jgi:hypothetical protein
MRKLLLVAIVATGCKQRVEKGTDSGSLADLSSRTDLSSPAPDGSSSGTTCDLQFGAMVCHGTLDPTTLGSGILPVMPAVSMGAAGQHYYCYPADPASYNQKMLFHLVGTGDDPARDNGLLRFACSLGFAAIAPSYEDTIAVNTVCSALATKTDQSLCFGQTRRAILYGEMPQVPPVSVSPDDSVLNRARTLLAALAVREPASSPWAVLSTRIVADDFSKFVLSGHSQGSGHALMLGRDYAADRVIMLSGPNDRVDAGMPGNSAVDWIANFYGTAPKTSAVHYYVYYNKGDTIGSVADYEANFDLIAVSASSCPFLGAATPAYPPYCRRVQYPVGCTDGLNAHGSTTVPTFGPTPTCALAAAGQDNQYTWRYMLTNYP